MRIQIFNKQGQKAYTVPVEDSSVYVWKLKDSEYIRIVFNSDFVLQLKKGYYTDIPTLVYYHMVIVALVREPTLCNVICEYTTVIADSIC